MAKLTPNYCTLYLARHGETIWNRQHRIQGHQDSPLTPAGELQAKKLAQQFRKVNFSAIFTSDLLRAKRTAQIIALDKKLAIITAIALRERNFGHTEGKTDTEFDAEFKDLLTKRDRLPDQERFKFKLAPDIESDEEVTSRLITYLREIATAYIGKNVLVVCHAGAMRALLVKLGFASYRELPGRAITNTAYVKLRSDGIDFFVDETFGIHKQIPSP